MILTKHSGSGRTFRSLLLLTAMAYLPQSAVADSEVPNWLTALAPASVKLSSQSWDVYDNDGFGKIGSGELKGQFPEFHRCAYAAGPEFELSLGYDSAWEASPEQLAMWEQMFLSELDFEGLPERFLELIKLSITEAAGEPVVGKPVVEDLPNGHIAYVEFDWKCAGNPGGANTMLQGYAFRDTNSLQFDFWVYSGREEAVAMATEILAKFEKLDFDTIRQ